MLVSPQIFSVKTVDLADGYTRYYRRSYVNMDRKKFDDYLKSMIPSKTEQIFAKCTNIRKEENGYVLLLSDGEKEISVFCKMLVGADGTNSIVRKTLFKNKKAEKYTAIQQVFEAENEKPFYACIFDRKTSPSCSWIFFKDGKCPLEAHLLLSKALRRLKNKNKNSFNTVW